jgi:S1-C subfamily serine protease
VDPLSLCPLYLECLLNRVFVGNATGFVAKFNGNEYLVTNWHVVTGRDADTKEPRPNGQADPTEIRVYFHDSRDLGTWVHQILRLRDPDNDDPLWLEHPDGSKVDVVALPLSVDDPRAASYFMDLSLAHADLALAPSEPLSVIGFPLGRSAHGHLPIWITGHLASDLEVDYQGKPVFLVDANTTKGMSGAPVVARRIPFRQTTAGALAMGAATRFLGIYSGRMDDRLNIGMVWKVKVIEEILRHSVGQRVG